jgi:hypothetical protein
MDAIPDPDGTGNAVGIPVPESVAIPVPDETTNVDILAGSTAMDPIHVQDEECNDDFSASAGTTEARELCLDIFWPSFKNAILSMTMEELRDEIWLTEELKEQIDVFFPQQHHINPDNNGRDREVLAEYLAMMFPKDRLFASRQQLFEAIKYFSAPWGFMTVHSNKQFMCSYSRDSSRTSKGKSLKDDVNCPFRIRYSFVGQTAKQAKAKVPLLHFVCKITNATYEHTCQCSPVSHRVARTISHKSIPPFEGLQKMVDLMRETPCVENPVMRKLLEDCVPQFQELSAKKLSHFRRAIFNYIFQNKRDLGRSELVLLQDAMSNSKPSYLEYCDIVDDPIMRPNFQEMLRTLMQKSEETWMVIRFLELTKEKMTGFLYKIRTDESGRPIGILWMTPEMRRNAARYSDLLFLDAQKRQMNSSGWPYIAPVVKNSEFKVAEAAASIVLEEDTSTYVWVLQTMTELEPQFLLDKISIIFGDEGISDILAVELGISDTVTIHGDHYHLFEHVWPNQFGPQLWTRVKPFLSTMFCSPRRENFVTAYECVRKLPGIRDRPDHLDYLERIFKNPNRYGGWLRQSLPGHMTIMGSNAAEQNHSSVVARIGGGGLHALSDHIKCLLVRQSDIAREVSTKRAKHQMMQKTFSSKFSNTGQCAIDTSAFKTLSQFGYNELFKPIRRIAFRSTVTRREGYKLVHDQHFDASSLSSSAAKTSKDVRLILNGKPCSCWRKIAWLVQCEHELTIDNKFDPSKYGQRWYSELYLKDLKIEFQCDPIPLRLMASPSSEAFPAAQLFSPGGELFSTSPKAQFKASYLESPPSAKRPNVERINYQVLLKRMTELARVVQNDQKAMQATMVAIDDIVKMAQDKHLDFKVIRTAFSVNEITPHETLNCRLSNPVSAASRNITNYSSVRRKRPASEIAASKRSRYIPSQKKKGPGTAIDSDIQHVSEFKRVYTKSCSLCKGPGHQFQNCPKITVHGVPLLRGNGPAALNARNQLFDTLSMAKYYLTSFMEPHELDRPLIRASFPQHVCGIILHRRLFKSLSKPWDVPNNYCFEVTLLDLLGDVKKDYVNAFFELNLISGFITRSKKNLVFNHMRLEPKSTPPPFSPAPTPAKPPALTNLPPYSCGSQETPTQGSVIQVDDTPDSIRFLSKMNVRCPNLAKFLAEDSEDLTATVVTTTTGQSTHGTL